MPDLSGRDLRRATDRYLSTGDGTSTRHSFSYGAHYDPDNVGFGALVAINTETVAPGGGYDEHRHEDVEIVTWVLEGELQHRDSTGQGGVIRPGTAQRLSAGEGAQHAERNASDVEPLVFVQMMLRSEHDAAPAYAAVDVPEGPGRHPAVGVQTRAWLEVVRPSAPVEIEVEERVLVHVARGSVTVDGETLDAGDELRVTGSATPLLLEGPGEALVWHLA
ncbi:pirin family protein [Aeromicrobium alkaliterrae]|uniref:Pirin family protein n=1 Tax=Aeromicrobium alkaliterrae TaxID=302168 RepID=A0ABN2JXP0_9ACTN